MTLKILMKHGLLLIDDDDAWVLEKYQWYSTVADAHCQITYARTRFTPGKTSLALHRVLLDAPPDMDVDHANGNGLDNRRENIRLATTSQNCANRFSRNSASGYKGVNQSGKKWVASIGPDHSIYLGIFATPEEAALAYADAAEQVYGEFANHDRDRALAALMEMAERGEWPASASIQTHCVNGHELTPENTYFRPDRDGRSRECLFCRRENARLSRERRAKAAS